MVNNNAMKGNSENTEENTMQYCIKIPEILFEILVRVPADDLLKLKCVSRKWRDLISTDCFRTAHLQRMKSRKTKLIVRHKGDYALLDLETMRYKNLSLYSLLKKRVTVLDALDGFVLLKPEAGQKIYIYNPITKRLTFLLTIHSYWEAHGYYFKLVLDTEFRKYKVFGICFKKCTLGYRGAFELSGIDKFFCVVTIEEDDKKGSQNNVLYKMLEDPAFFHTAYSKCVPVIVDRVLYWIAFKSSKKKIIMDDDDSGFVLQRWDILKEIFMGSIEFPCQPSLLSEEDESETDDSLDLESRENQKYNYIGLSAESLKNSLSLTLTTVNYKECIEVWSLVDSGEPSWVKQSRVSLCIMEPIDLNWFFRRGFNKAFFVTATNGDLKLNNILVMNEREENKLKNMDCHVPFMFKFTPSFGSWG